MKAYEAFSSWATMVIGHLLGAWVADPASALPGQRQVGLRRHALADADHQATDGLADRRGRGRHQAPLGGFLDLGLAALARLVEIDHRNHVLLTSFLISLRRPRPPRRPRRGIGRCRS